MIYPGETATHSFTIPFTLSGISEVLVTYEQDDYNAIERTIKAGDGTTGVLKATDNDETTFEITLTQAETLRLKNGREVHIQLNVISGDGAARYVSRPIDEMCGTQYHKEVIE
jgi:VCBS repeat-containing protein